MAWIEFLHLLSCLFVRTCSQWNRIEDSADRDDASNMRSDSRSHVEPLQPCVHQLISRCNRKFSPHMAERLSGVQYSKQHVVRVVDIAVN